MAHAQPTHMYFLLYLYLINFERKKVVKVMRLWNGGLLKSRNLKN